MNSASKALTAPLLAGEVLAGRWALGLLEPCKAYTASGLLVSYLKQVHISLYKSIPKVT